MLKCIENCGPRHPPKRVLWDKLKKFQVYFIRIYFLRHQTKKLKCSQSYAAMLLYLLLNFLLSTCPTNMETEKWPKKNDFPLMVEIIASALTTVIDSFKIYITNLLLEQKDFKANFNMSIAFIFDSTTKTIYN